MKKPNQPVSQSIDLDIARELHDKEFRDAYFRAELEVDIPRQIKGLRKLRGLTQKELAEELHTKQSAISRLEAADYGRWGMDTLLGLAEALGARMSVVFQPYEAVIVEYQQAEASQPGRSAATEGVEGQSQDDKRLSQRSDAFPLPGPTPKKQTVDGIPAEGKRGPNLN